ncbi:MAG TPA: non-heme iron oxygenase ferredoxin subunit [Ktedonobacterales bacterium]|jgi:3-phenylpropionate/trans-cinnamate dioxygenase ferredoxin subunit
MASVVEVCSEAEAPQPGQALSVVVGDIPIAIFNIHGEYYAIGDICTHEEYPLSEGDMVEEYTVECALHGATFDVRTGDALTLPATGNAGSYPVWVQDGALMVELPDE